MDRFYVTTPIYYVNDVPHIGHAYTTIAADILARYNRLKGRRVFFLTGTDEHGQKVEKASREKGRSPKEHADVMVENFNNLWEKLNISYDAFIRTTDREHVRTVQGIIQILWDKGEIEKREYSGWYCTPDERFWTEKEIIDGNCPDCGRPVEEIQEENYFFLMSKYQERLVTYIEDNPDYIQPPTRKNEVLGFLKNNRLGDLCISRPKSRLSWGIPFPFDEDFTTYVWFDALINYFSATRYLVSHPETARLGDFWWPASHHIVGKDILTTHAVYWSTMLMALEFPLPENIYAHGWWTVEGKKMSKSLGNVVDPYKMVDLYGADAFRYFLFREVPFGLDGDFSEDALINRINRDLANDLGNLLNRFLAMAEKYLRSAIEMHPPADVVKAHVSEHEKERTNTCEYWTSTHWSHLGFNHILEGIWWLVSATNNFIAKTEPWRLAKDDQPALKSVMYQIWQSLRITAIFLYPFMPVTAEKMWLRLGLGAEGKSLEKTVCENPDTVCSDWHPRFSIRISKGEPLFPRIENVGKT